MLVHDPEVRHCHLGLQEALALAYTADFEVKSGQEAPLEDGNPNKC